MSDETPPPEYGFDRLPEPLPGRAYATMAIVLRAGLFLSVALFVLGLVLFFVERPYETLADLAASQRFLRFLVPSELVAGLAQGDPTAILSLGMFTLVATPMARVLTGMFYFRAHHEKVMTSLTLTVLILLLVGSLLLGPYLAHL